ncbi:MAG: GNAT family N-acetyltransferase [Bermanella sp.]
MVTTRLVSICTDECRQRCHAIYPAWLTQPESDELVKKLSLSINKRGWGFWALELKTTGEFIGFTGLHKPEANLPFNPCVEIGWRLGKKHWGKGYATEAAQLAQEFAFKQLLLAEVVSFTSSQNSRSRSVMQRLNMLDTQQNFNHPAIAEGHPLREHVLFKITGKQWQALR